MEKIEYREVVFNVIRTLSCERTPIKDAANNYLYTHWEFSVEAHYHPVLTSYSLAGANPAPISSPGNMPGATDLALLTRLLQPRGLLKVTAGDSVILETPNVGYPCDVRGGPSVDLIGVPLMVGIKHWVVTLRFTADVRDVGQHTSQAVISNLWVSSEDIDFQRRSIRRFAGRAILRQDIMRRTQVNANSFRDLYLFKCPGHYQRQNVQVKLSEDGTTLDWSFEDAMRGYDLGASSPIVNIECFKTGYVKAGSPGKMVTDAIRHGAHMAVMAAGFDIVSAGTSLIAAGTAATALAVHDNLPRAYMQCRCDITGDRNADLGRLTSIALGVCLSQVGITIASFLTGTAELIFRQDVADQVYTSAEFTLHWTDDAAFVLAGFQAVVGGDVPGAVNTLLGGSARVVTSFLTDNRTLKTAPGFNGGLQFGNVVADRSGENYNLNPPLTQGAYGAVPNTPVPAGSGGFVPDGIPNGNIPVGIERLIVQALLGQDQFPPSPTTLVSQS